MRSNSLLTILLFVFMTGNLFSQRNECFFPASSENFNYMGRVDFSDLQMARYDWPGVTVRFRFTGNKLKLRFKGG